MTEECQYKNAGDGCYNCPNLLECDIVYESNKINFVREK
jgi:hypothetical protein